MRCCAFAARNSCRVLSDYGWRRVKALCVKNLSSAVWNSISVLVDIAGETRDT